MAHIAVGGGEGGVSKLLLDDRHRYAFHHQFVCMGMTQAMRMYAFFDLSLFGETWQEGAHVGGFQRFALERAEQRGVSVDAEGVSGFEPAAEDRHRSRIKGDDSSAISFAVEHREGP